MFSWLFYYLLLIPLSRLPLSILYIVSKIAYFILYKVVGYRKIVVYNNLQQSYPEKSEAEINAIAKEFYKYLSNLLAESIKNLTISEEKLAARIVVVNPEVMDRLYDQNKSVILLGSHLFNWEFLITAQNFLFKHQAIGIGTPLSNSFLNKKINKRRGRFGMAITTSDNYKEVIAEYNKLPIATLILGDQSPSKANNSLWLPFLNRVTPFYFGAEILANEMDSAVVYCQLEITKKGYYQIKLKEITTQPKKEAYAKIISNYASELEGHINISPQYWLWSHKRWKMQIPANIEDLKNEHKTRFEKKFR